MILWENNVRWFGKVSQEPVGREKRLIEDKKWLLCEDES